MKLFNRPSLDTLSEISKLNLFKLEKSYGLIPNIFEILGESTETLDGYMSLRSSWEKVRLDPVERELVMLTVSVENECPYGTSEHSFRALNILKIAPEIVDSVKIKVPLTNPRLNALVVLTREIVSLKGKASKKAIHDFLEQGFANPQLMEVLVGVALNTITNYFYRLSPVEIDEEFKNLQ